MSETPVAFAIAQAAMHASLHSLRIIANRGLVSPADLDETLDGVTETLENLPVDWQAILQKNYDPIFAELKQIAKARWDGQK